jgi:hypothetical protein
VAGLGLGPAYAAVEPAAEDVTPRYGFGASLRLGYAPSDHWLVTLGGGDAVAFGDGFAFTVAAGVLGRYYVAPRAPSIFLELGLGLGVWVEAVNDESHAGVGLHPIAVIGYEVRRHWSVELLVAGGPTVPEDSSSRAAVITLAWLGY